MPAGLVLEHDWFSEPLPDNVMIGPNSWLYSSYSFLHFHSQREPAVKIGASCGIYDGTFFELGPEGTVEIGDYTALVGVIFSTNGAVSIGHYSFLAHEVVIADHHAMIPPCGRPPATGDRAGGAGEILIGDEVWIGAGVTILSGAKIGTGSVIGAGAVIDFEVPAMTIVAGNPAFKIGTVSR
jgi:acetyltransferase-like isoleucine patch superfamily enzyme